jgi:hypothetical protein
MQEQGLLMMLFIMFIAPMVLLFSNHDMFFIVIALILLISSAISIKNRFFGKRSTVPLDDEEELMDEFGEYINLDIEKFDQGTRVVRHSIAIIFFIYSSFYLQSIWFSILLALVILFWIYRILEDVLADGSTLLPFKSPWLKDSLVILNSVASLVIIIAATLNKFSGMKF